MKAEEHMEQIKAAIRNMQVETGVAIDSISVYWLERMDGKMTFANARFDVRVGPVEQEVAQ